MSNSFSLEVRFRVRSEIILDPNRETVLQENVENILREQDASDVFYTTFNPQLRQYFDDLGGPSDSFDILDDAYRKDCSMDEVMNHIQLHADQFFFGKYFDQNEDIRQGEIIPIVVPCDIKDVDKFLKKFYDQGKIKKLFKACDFSNVKFSRKPSSLSDGHDVPF